MNAITLGIVGCGRATQELHLPALQRQPMWKVEAAADLDRQQLEAAAGRFNISRRYHEAQELLDDPALDAVAICTPAGAHAVLALAALAAGKHVLVEKPLALSLGDAERMVEAAAASRSVAAVGFNFRCHRLVRRARALIASGALGKIHQVVTVWGSAMQHDPGFPEWRRNVAKGGGALVELGIHHLDGCRFLLADEFATIQMMERSAACEHESVSLLGSTRSGVLISCSFSQVTSPVNEIRIVGDRGALSFSLYRADSFSFTTVAQSRYGLRARLQKLRGLREWPEILRSARGGGDYLLAYGEEWNRFALAIRDQGQPAGSFADGLEALKIIQAAIRSSESGRAESIQSSERK